MILPGKDFRMRNNNELVATAVISINRVAVLTNKYYNGICKFLSRMNFQGHRWLNSLTELKAYPAVISSSLSVTDSVKR
jgi:methionyl-tRNA synthetase